jgi:hypothetical protein
MVRSKLAEPEPQISAMRLEQLLAEARWLQAHRATRVLLQAQLASLPEPAAVRVEKEQEARSVVTSIAVWPGLPSAHRQVWRCEKDQSWA